MLPLAHIAFDVPEGFDITRVPFTCMVKPVVARVLFH